MRTVTYNYDLSQSVENNAYNFNPLYKPVKQQPIKTPKPRALASITIPMAQSQSDIRTNAQESTNNLLSVAVHLFAFSPNTSFSPSLSALQYGALVPPDLHILHSIFRI
jgi:hypothetical protein